MVAWGDKMEDADSFVDLNSSGRGPVKVSNCLSGGAVVVANFIFSIVLH